MTPGDQVPFYIGKVVVGGLQIPVLPGSAFINPRADQSQPIIGNYYESPSFAEGLRMPMVNLIISVRDKTTEALGTTFLNWFFNRTTDESNNTGLIPGGVQFWNGIKGFSMRGAKLDSIQLGFSKQSLSMSVRIVGANEGATAAVTPLVTPPTWTEWDDTALIPGFKVTGWPDGATAPDCMISGSLTLSNNHRPNPCSNGSEYPKSMDASQLTAGLQLVRRTSADDLVSGTPFDIRIDGVNIDRTFRFYNPRWQTMDNLTIEAPENYQQWAAQVKGRSGNLSPVAYL